MKKILVINGPNLNFLGIREPEIYGTETYTDLVKSIEGWAKEIGMEVRCVQSNHEGVIIDEIQNAYKKYDGIIINAGGYTHTSIAIMDAVKAVGIDTVEVHLSDIDGREDFRRMSYVGLACKEHFIGLSFEGYKLALEYLFDGNIYN
ncbi:MAG: type II 3-dehydroquinate dehydratase [Oscillospiraceae bacterium]